MESVWPDGFTRILDEPWVAEPVSELATGYDALDGHGWYANLDPTVAELADRLAPGDIAIDYSGGTGILIRRLLARIGDRPVGLVNVDASAKFLRLAVERLRHDERVAVRHLRFVEEERQLQGLDEVLAGPLLRRGVDAIVSANAVHLYPDLEEVFASWRRVVRPEAVVLVQSGNIRHDGAARIIDDTVHAIDRTARRLVADDDAYARWRPVLADAARMQRYDDLRSRYFLPPRSLGAYRHALEVAGFAVDEVTARPVVVSVAEWTAFLAVYHEGILGWLGGSKKVEGHAPSEEDVAARVGLLRHSAVAALGSDTFEAVWTYLRSRPA